MQQKAPPGFGGAVSQSCALVGAWLAHFPEPMMQVPPAEAQALPMGDDEVQAIGIAASKNKGESHRIEECYVWFDLGAAVTSQQQARRRPPRSASG